MIIKGGSINTRLLQERMRIQEGYNELIKALKSDDADAAYKALTGMSPQDLQLTNKEFQELTRQVGAASQAAQVGPSKTLDDRMNAARAILGVQKNQPQTTQTHNPVTGQPWSSSSAQQLKPTVALNNRLTKNEIDYIKGWAFKDNPIVKANFDLTKLSGDDLSYLISELTHSSEGPMDDAIATKLSAEWKRRNNKP